MTEASAPVASTASATELNTGRPRWVVPPLPGVTPPTILVPYSLACSLWKVPCEPVKPWQMTLVSLLIRMLIGCSPQRSEEHTSELQSRENLVCRLLLEKKKINR